MRGGPAWRAALRMARRDVLRSRARSLMVIAMVATPVAATCLVSVLYATSDATPAEALGSELGGTQAELIPVGRIPVVQSPEAVSGSYTQVSGGQVSGGQTDGTDRPWTAAELAALSGGTVHQVRSAPIDVRSSRGRVSVEATELDLGAPSLAATLDLQAGRLPVNPAEVVVDRAVADLGFPLGSRLATTGGARTATVVGIARHRQDPTPWSGRVVTGLPGSLLAPGADGRTRYLVDRAAPLPWSQVLDLNARGLA